MTFKMRLLLGAAAPFMLAVPAYAQTTISTATTTPVSTSTTGDLTVATGGAVTLTSQPNTTAVTVNTNNTVTNNATISTVNSDNTVGVRILPNLTTSYSGTGVISLIEDYTRTDTDSDGDLDGPNAQGTGRIGILVEPGGTLNGNLTISSPNGAISIEGNNSYGISVRSVLNGDFRMRGGGATQAGGINVIGANSVGIDLREDVTGNVNIGSATNVEGQGSIGVNVLGDVIGEFMVDGTVVATGFTSKTDNNYVDPDTLKTGDKTIAERRDADDLLIGGPALAVRGDLARGFLINGNAIGGVDPTTNVKDVVQNFNENRTAGTVASYGSAPAVLIQALDGAAGDQINLGKVRESVRDTLDDDKDSNLDEIIGVFNYDYGFINRGLVTSNGLNVGFAATGVKIAGSADGTHQTIVDGGIFNGGAIVAQAFEANSIALNIGSGASTPQLVNSGTISATATTETNHDSYAVRIDAGANLPAVVNGGSIIATTRGYDGDAVAFQDLSGTVTSFTNNSRIAAGYIDNDSTDAITSGLGQAIAVDLSHSGSNVTFTQNDTVDNTRIFGDVLFGVGADRLNLLSGEITGDILFGTGADTLAITSAKLNGNATFGGTGATVNLNGADWTGDMLLGSASGALSFTNGSVFNGGIFKPGAGAVSMSVDNATVNNSAAGTLNLSSMTLANTAKVGFVIDNTRIAGNVPIFNVAGTANIAANTVFTPIFQQFTNTPFTLRVLNAGTLNLGGPVGSMLNANSPYLFDVSLVRPAATQSLDLVFRVKTAAELGLNERQAGAYGAVLDLLEENDDVATAVTSIPGAESFLHGWSDLLPGSDASVMRVLSSNATAAFGATARRLDLISDKPDAPGGAWTEEFGVYHSADASSSSAGVSGGGFGVAAGVDLISTGTALIGAYASLESAELEEDDRTGAPLNVAQTSFGAYGGWINGNLAVNGAASVGFVDFTSDRKVEIGSLSDRLRGEWKGRTYTAGARATYTMPLGWLDMKPFVAADYTGFEQDGYTETGATNADLALIAGDGDASLATASYGLAFVGNLGSDDAYSIKPEFTVGYRNILTWDDNPAPMRFAGGTTGNSFTLAAGNEPEDALVAGLGLNVDSQFLNIKVGYDAEISDNAITHYGSITLRMAFW